jgi:hypothetical protein
MRLVKILIRKGIEIDLVRLTQVDPSFVYLCSRCGLIGRFRQRCIFFKKGFRYGMHHAKTILGWRTMWNKVQHDMNEQNDIT